MPASRHTSSATLPRDFTRIRFFRMAVLGVAVIALLLPERVDAQTHRRAKKPAAEVPASPPAAAPVVVAPTPPPPPPPDPLGRGTPHDSVLGFLRAAEAQDYARAAEYMDAKRTGPPAEPLAAQLKYLLDLGTSTDIDSLSRSPDGNSEDQLRVSRDRVGVIKTASGDLDVLLDRIERPGKEPIWLFSQETLYRVPIIYAGVQHKDLALYFPAWMSRVLIFSVPLWRWAGIGVSVVILLIAATAITRGLLWLLHLVLRRRLTARIESGVLSLRGPAFGLMLGLITRMAADYALTALGRHYWERAGLLVLLVSGAWMLVRLSNIFASIVCHRLTLQLQVERVTFVGLLARLFNILVGIVLILVLLAEAGVNVSALVAGLGIGGIALALAAQKTLADLFGGISVIMRGAVRVGDFCTVAGQTGMVEEIGSSSLRLRTTGRSVVSIPNSKVAELELENFSLRDQFWLNQVFTLRFDTPHTSVETILEKIVALLKARADIDATSARARLIKLTPSGPQIEIFAYYQRPGSDFAEFLKEQEQVILDVMRVIEEAGTSMAAPIAMVRIEPKDAPALPDRLSPRASVDRGDDGI